MPGALFTVFHKRMPLRAGVCRIAAGCPRTLRHIRQATTSPGMEECRRALREHWVAVEIERKFLVANERWRDHVSATLMLKDGLVVRDDDAKVRVRSYGDRTTLTVKGRRDGMRREEFEYDIPPADAEALFRLCGDHVLEKARHIVPWHGHTWEIDVYRGLLDGVVIAEVELASEASSFVLPDWIGVEVTGDPRYKKINMLRERLARRRPLQAVG